MSQQLIKFREDVGNSYKLGVEILIHSRALKGISLDLKLLAVNGIVQAGKIGSAQGQSLITLSGFLSDLPVQIAPELEQLEVVTSELASQLTLTSISIIRFIFYSSALSNLLDEILIKQKSSFRSGDFNLLSIIDLLKLTNNPLLKGLDSFEKNNIDMLAKVNADISLNSIEMLNKSIDYLKKSEQRILNLKRNGFIANYMGSNILIESSYLDSNQQSFQALVSNIRGIVDKLNFNLDNMDNSIKEAKNVLKKVILLISNTQNT